MSEFIWKDRYKIGDAQHQHLFELANRSIEASNEEEITLSLMPLYQHIREHFQGEENLMKQHCYPCYLEFF